MLEVKGAEEVDGHLSGKLDSQGMEKGGEEELLEVLALGETLVPSLLRRLADDNVGPCGVEAAQDGGPQRGEVGRGMAMHREASHELRDGKGERDPDEEHGETTEARQEASLRAQVAKGATDLGGDGLGADEEEFLLHVADLGIFLVEVHEGDVWVLIGVFGRRGLDDGRGCWGFDHGKGFDDGEGVGQLKYR